MKLSKDMRKRIVEERDKIFDKMSADGVDSKDWDCYKKKYDGYNELLKRDWKISPDTMLVVGGNLLGILLILGYEKADIITSKAMSFVLKGKV